MTSKRKRFGDQEAMHHAERDEPLTVTPSQIPRKGALLDYDALPPSSLDATASDLRKLGTMAVGGLALSLA